MIPDVFISHAGDDAGVAVEVCALLEAHGLRCWIAPRDVAAGLVWDEAILDAIETSRVFLLILSKSANDSQFVKNEVNRAFSKRKPIVTFRLEEVIPGRSLELYLARHHWTDAFPPPMEARVERLAGSITALLDSSATPAPAPAVAPPVRPTLGSRILSPLLAVSNRVRGVSGKTVAYALVGSLIVAGVASFVTWNLKPIPSPPSKPLSRFTITLPPGQQLAGLESGLAVALSPDGTHLAYVAREGSTQQIYLRAMDSLEARAMPDTEGGTDPFFSPDGKWLGFLAGNKLKKVSVSGGAAVTLSNSALTGGASWGSQGMIVFTRGIGILQQVSDAGGTVKPVTHLQQGEIAHFWPEFLPGGKALLFTATTGPGSVANYKVAVQSLVTGERQNLVQVGIYPRYASSGHLVYAQGGSLMAVPFDPQRLTVTGTAVPVAENVMQSASDGNAQYSFSTTGLLVYVPGGLPSAPLRLVWVSRNGTEQPLAAPAHAYVNPRLSPDGRRVAVGIWEQDFQVWLYDLSRETLTRLTFEGNFNNYPVWAPDGKRIAFTSTKEGSPNVFWQLADGSGGLERLTTNEYVHVPMSWSPDGQLLAFIELDPTTGNDIWVLRMGDPSAGSGQVRKAQPFLRTSFNESVPRFSPDGRWLAYISNESGRYEIYVQPYPGPGGKWQISTEGGTEPVWNPNGRELFYRSGNKMMAVGISTQAGFTAGKPHVLFEGLYVPTPGTSSDYDVSPDGQRFLMLKPVEQEQAAPAQINVVLNWFEELKQKVPAGKK